MASAKAHWAYNNYADECVYDTKEVLVDHSSYGSSYSSTQRTFWGTLVILDGERYAIWDSSGNMRIVDGPVRESLWRCSYQQLTLYSAGPTQYLIVELKDGSRKNVQGPSSMWFDPSIHKSITLGNCYTLATNEAIVVYNKSEGGKVQRKVVTGPCLYMPDTSEWVHKFNWGNKLNANDRSGVRKDAFSKLQTAPDTMDVEVQYVRTADDGHLDINLMVYFQLVNIDKLLDNSQDPITDITNAIASDVILAVSKNTFYEFKSSTEKLNSLALYGQAMDQASRIGYKIDRVVFKGYQAGEALQRMQNDGISSRTKLHLEQEQETQNQKLKDYVLEKDSERAAKKQALEVEEQKNKIQLRELQLLQEQKEKDAVLQKELAAMEERNKLQLAFLSGLKALGVDLTQVLVAQYTQNNSNNSKQQNQKK